VLESTNPADLALQQRERLRDALVATTDAKIRRRIYDLVLYTRYIDKIRKYQFLSTPVERQAAYEELMRYVYRIRRSHMVASYGFWRSEHGIFNVTPLDPIPPCDQAAPGSPCNGLQFWQEPESVHPWKQSVPLGEADYTAEERLELGGPSGNGTDGGWIKEGIDTNPTITWDSQVKTYDTSSLVPAGHLVPSALPDTYYPVDTVNTQYSDYWHERDYQVYTWVQAPGTVTIEGLCGNPETAPPAPGLSTLAELQVGAAFDENEPQSSTSFACDQVKHPLTFATSFSGLHRFNLEPGHFSKLIPANGVPHVVASSPDEVDYPHSKRNRYFYVPRGTSVVGFYTTGAASLFVHYPDKAPKLALTLADEETTRGVYVGINVAAGDDGKWWRFHRAAGYQVMLTVPPYFGRRPSEMMLPKALVDAGG